MPFSAYCTAALTSLSDSVSYIAFLFLKQQIRYAGDTRSYVCPQTWLNEARINIGLSPTVGFLNENDCLAYFAILENCRQVCLTVDFFKTKFSLSLS